MCNRYSKAAERTKIQTEMFGVIAFESAKRYNIAPTQSADVVLVENGKLVHREMGWGWSTKHGDVTNAQAETATQKMWRRAWDNGRCLIPADGWFEWTKDKPAQPYRIVRTTGNPFCFAGLYDNGCFAILTRPAEARLKALHHREPIVLKESEFDWWLGPGDGTKQAGCSVIARGVPASAMNAYKVTPEMWNPQFDSPAVIEPYEPIQIPLMTHPIESDQWRWREVTEAPPEGTISGFVLIDDETVETAMWERGRWKAAKGGTVLKWRPARSLNINHG